MTGLSSVPTPCWASSAFLTCGPDECRAWTIKKGTKAPQAAGKIHSDFERGFIRAEIVAFDDLKACGSMAAAKEKGLVRSEGKDYVMQRRRRYAVPLQRVSPAKDAPTRGAFCFFGYSSLISEYSFCIV